ncbi:hypothetical protein LIER_00135 [Lithospermum erythrorhizon]|uniref:Uncharacterized protein n=1 Tax=Lithospermum erythrorhizon TaxID=34254 RepID=A0AAV3NGU5_LITER
MAIYIIASASLAVKEKKEAVAQTLAEIKKHDLLQARFTKLEGEHFHISNKFQHLELVHSQTTKKVSELEQRAKTYKEVNPSIVAKYLDFIQSYPEEWFAALNLSAPITPNPEEEEEDAPPAPADVPAS